MPLVSLHVGWQAYRTRIHAIIIALGALEGHTNGKLSDNYMLQHLAESIKVCNYLTIICHDKSTGI